jgi:RNA polymerase-binding transcription factor DksA
MREPSAKVVRRRLVARRREVLSRYEHLGALVDEEPVDDAARRWDAAVLAKLADADLLALADIEHALLRLERSDYGRCCDCHEAIDPDRLAAVPEASRCIACAHGVERAAGHHLSH